MIGDAALDARWRLAFLGVDCLLDDLGLDSLGRLRVLAAARELLREHGLDKQGKRLGERLRKERKALEALRAGDVVQGSPMALALPHVAERSLRVKPLVTELQERAETGRLGASLEDLATSFVHMHVNRLVRSAPRAHEAVIDDFLWQLDEARRARGLTPDMSARAHTEEIAMRSERLFRQQALDEHARTFDREGAVLRIAPAWTSAAYWLVTAVAGAGLAFVALASVPRYAEGPALVRVEGKGFELAVVPGLLQTEDYARAITSAAWPDNPEESERRVALRMARQACLVEEPLLKFWGIVDEAVLHRRTGGDKVMQAQLRHLVELGKMPNVIQAVPPFSEGWHRGTFGSFSILDFPDGVHSPVAYVSSQAGDAYLEREDEMKRVTLTYTHLQTAALSASKSRELIAAIARTMA